MKIARCGLGLALLLWAGGGGSTVNAAKEKPLYFGTARIFNFKTVTVVYPASDSQEVETNRFSAMRKVAFLAAVHGVDGQVIADSDFDFEAPNGNLLVLGWDNLLLPRIAGPGFIDHERGRRLFLGGIPIEHGEDLLFASRSPFSPDHRVIFWSRIDPELDRFSVMPFIASDFAVFDVFQVQHQGNYGDWNSNPPTRQPAAEMDFRSLRPTPDPLLRGPRHEIIVHGDITREMAEAVLAAREQALQDIERRLGSFKLDRSIRVHVYATGEQKNEQSSVPDPTHAVPRRSEIHLLLRHAQSASAHEDLHLVAQSRFGPCRSTALYEGFALAYEQDDHDLTLATVAAHLLETENLPTVAELLDEESFRALGHDGTGFAMAALFVRWFRDQFSDEIFGRAYSVNEPGVQQVAEFLPIDAATLEADFHSFLVQRATGATSDLRFHRAVAESQHFRNAGDDVAARAALERALEVRPDDPGTLYGIGLIDLEAQRNDAALALFQRLLKQDLADDSRYRIFGHYQLARARLALGQNGKAERELQRMLDLPDRHDSHSRARGMLATLKSTKKKQGKKRR